MVHGGFNHLRYRFWCTGRERQRAFEGFVDLGRDLRGERAVGRRRLLHVVDVGDRGGLELSAVRLVRLDDKLHPASTRPIRRSVPLVEWDCHGL